jgi:hypothetical protein
VAPKPIETPTLVERFIRLIPLPYPLAALVWTVVLGAPGFATIEFVLTGSSTLSAANLPNTLLNLLLTFYLFLMVRYIRMKVVAAEALIAPRLSGGERDYHQAFAGMTRTAPVIALASTMGALLLASYGYGGIMPSAPLLIAFNVILVSLNALAFSTFLWEFAIASHGLYKLGSSSLRLGSFLEDRMMGSTPMGNLALSLTIAYFGSLLFAWLLFSTFVPSTAFGTASFAASLLLGVALFFVPLASIHAKMRMEKRRLLREIGARYARLTRNARASTDDATMDDLRVGLARLTELQELEVMERKVASLPTWPFGIQVVSRFVTIVVSVTAVLVARIVTDFLHI